MSLFRKLLVAVLLIHLGLIFANAQTNKEYSNEEIEKVEKIFQAANDLMEQRKFAEALAKYQEGLAITPDSAGMLYNGGLAAFQTKQFDTALTLWKKLKDIDKEDWQVRAKIIQVYQNLGKTAERDKERTELFDLRKAGKVKTLNEADFYVREQTEIANRRLMIFEHFELKGSRALRYVFHVLGNDGKSEYRISLGSYDTTNNIWREMEKKKGDERLFHLDGYFQNGGHATYGMFPKEPTYDETREMVVKILEKQQKPISSSTVVNAPKKEEKP